MTKNQGKGGRKLALRAGTAMVLVFAASAAHAQCADPRGAGGSSGSLSFAQTLLPASSTVSGVQSLVSVLTTQNTAFLTQTSAFIGAPSNPAANTNGGGVWARGIGGTFDTNTPGNFTRFSSPLNPTDEAGSCNVRTFQDYAGFQTGADIARLNIDGYNIHTGVTVGYTESSVRSNGAFRADFQTPFVGLYGAITKDTFFADAQVRWDFFQGVLNDPTNTLTNQRLDARSISITGNVGYQIPLNDGWFVEPSAGAIYAEAKVDTLQTGGPIFVSNFTSFAAPTSVKIRDFDSLLARGSLRIGKNIITDGYAVQPFVTATVINEFGGPVRTDVSTSFGAFGATLGPVIGVPPDVAAAQLGQLDTRARISTYRIGTYGQFSAGVAGQILNTGWLGYFRGDYRTGDRVEGWGLSAGLRYQFNPDTTRPLITKGDSPVLASLDGPVSWTGISAGASVGGLWSQTTQTVFVPFFVDTALVHAAGVYAGGQVGLDYQVGPLVVGVAGDAGYTNARGGRGCSAGFGGNIFNCQTNVDDLYMATARFGYALDRSLFYVKGGAAFAHTSERQQENFAAPFSGSTVTFPNSAASALVTGWTIGGGFEYALTRNWSAKAEYMHVDFEPKTYQLSANNSAIFQAQASGDIVKIGVNYRFTPEPLVPAPVVAQY